MADQTIVISQHCQCGNDDPSKFWKLFNPENRNELWGLCCKKKSCLKEYLIGRFANEDAECVMIANGVLLFENIHPGCPLDPDFQVRLSRTKVRNLDDVEPGDHVGFDRAYLIWHHAIVVEVNETNVVIEGWDGMFKSRIVRKTVERNELKHLYKFQYSNEIQRRNPPELVIARSNSRVHPEGEDAGVAYRLYTQEKYEEHYAFFNANCEHFATYCKTGMSMCNQTRWLIGKLKDALSTFVAKAWKSCLALMATEVLENMAQEVTGAVGAYNATFEMIGLIGVIMVETVSFSRALKKLKEELRREDGGIDQRQYREELGKRLIELLLVILVAGGGGIIISACFTPLVEVIICPILVIGVKLGVRFITRFMNEDLLVWFGKQWELLEDTLRNIKDGIIAIKNAIVDATHKAVDFVKTEVVPRIISTIEAIREFFAWLIC